MIDDDPEFSTTEDVARYEEETAFVFHPLASIFPMMSEDGIDKLAADIDAHGLQDDIVMQDDMLLDGRARAVACARIGKNISNRVIMLSDNADPIAYLISKHIRRKQLTPAQIDLAALALATTTHGGSRRRGGQPEADQVTDSVTWQKPEITRADAARRFGIAVSQISTAAAVQKNALPEIRTAIASGKIKTTGYAYVIITPNKDEKHDGLTSEDKQRKWLADPRNSTAKRKPKIPRPDIPITPKMLKAKSDKELAAIAVTIMDRANRHLAQHGQKLILITIGEASAGGAAA